jgi:hypothetical protein
MKEILCFLILLIVCPRCAAQSDTIFLKDRTITACRIHFVGPNSIEYSTFSEQKQILPLYDVLLYSRNGVRTAVGGRMALVHKPGKVDSVNVSDELTHIRYCISNFHKQYTNGLSVVLIGGALTGASFFLPSGEDSQKLLGAGGIIMMIIGTAITIDSHKWFGRAGWGVSGKGNMVEVRYRFK